RERWGRDGPGVLVLRPPGARPDQDPILLPEDRRHASGRGRASPQASPVTPRDAARAIFDSALAAGDVTPLVRRHVGLDSGHRRALAPGRGRAGAARAAAAEQAVGTRIGGGFVVVKDGCAVPVPRVEIAEAGPPVPDARGPAASARLLELARGAGNDDLVL